MLLSKSLFAFLLLKSFPNNEVAMREAPLLRIDPGMWSVFTEALTLSVVRVTLREDEARKTV